MSYTISYNGYAIAAQNTSQVFLFVKTFSIIKSL